MPLCLAIELLQLRAAAGGAAVGALVAGAVADHEGAALVARGGVGLLDPGAILDLDGDEVGCLLFGLDEGILGEQGDPGEV